MKGYIVMKKFIVKVNGTSYEVEIEEVSAGASSFVQSPVASTTVAEPKKTEQKAEAAKNDAVDGVVVKAPLPGNILDVRVSAGQTVKSGDILMILEAMKMENEILAPNDGVIASVNTSKGATVGTGDVLVVLK